MDNTRVLIIGGSSGMGLALAERLVTEGADVRIAGRSADRLAAAARRLAGVRTHRVDIAYESQVRALFADAGELDHVVVTAANVHGAYSPIGDFSLANAQAALAIKLVGPWLVAKHAAPHLVRHGSLTFTSGIAAYRPSPGSSILAAANGALPALARSLAVELAPIRVNVVSPGWIDTPIWDTLAGAAKHERLDAMAARLPVGRIGRPEDVAQAFLAVLANGFLTGEVLHVDGGHRLV
jgi:NAD(P)-dependent dehydrogenase (short-subunit alcohol dehydrogenase family)